LKHDTLNQAGGGGDEKNFKITPRAEDYSQWYADVISAAEVRHTPERVGHRPECVGYTTERVGHSPGRHGHFCESHGHALEKNFKITPRADDYSQWYADVISDVDVLMCVLDTLRASWIHPQRHGHTSERHRHTRGSHVHTPESYGHLPSVADTIGESLKPPPAS